jgi:hypothetical protein
VTFGCLVPPPGKHSALKLYILASLVLAPIVAFVTLYLHIRWSRLDAWELISSLGKCNSPSLNPIGAAHSKNKNENSVLFIKQYNFKNDRCEKKKKAIWHI